MKFRCDECGRTFYEEEARLDYDDPSPDGISLPQGAYAYPVCPYCGSDSFSEVDEMLTKQQVKDIVDKVGDAIYADYVHTRDDEMIFTKIFNLLEEEISNAKEE